MQKEDRIIVNKTEFEAEEMAEKHEIRKKYSEGKIFVRSNCTIIVQRKPGAKKETLEQSWRRKHLTLIE